MTSPPARYLRTAKAVLAAVEAWAKTNPTARPAWRGLALDTSVAVAAELQAAIDMFSGNVEAKQLGAAAVAAAPDATWLMFSAAMDRVYGPGWRKPWRKPPSATEQN